MPEQQQILNLAVVGVPDDYVIGSNVELLLRAVNATFTDNGAGSDWLPAVELLSDSGHVIARAVDQGVKITAGGDAEVSWFPWVKRKALSACPVPSPVQGVAALLIGQGSSTGGADLTIAVDRCPCYPGTLYVIAADASNDQTKFGAPLVWTVTDTQGGAYTPVGFQSLAPYASIPNQDDGALGSGIAGLNVGPSAQRTLGASDTLGTSDSITVTWEPGYAAGEPFAAVGVAILVVGINDVAVGDHATGGGVSYANGDSYPGNLATQDLSWVGDFGGFDTPNPVAATVMLATAAAYPAAGPYTPLAGVLVAEVDDVLSLIVSAEIVQPAGVDIDPGGSWSGTASTVVGNYQFAQVA